MERVNGSNVLASPQTRPMISVATRENRAESKYDWEIVIAFSAIGGCLLAFWISVAYVVWRMVA